MKKLIATAALLICPLLAMAGNYAECLLDKLPGIQNDATARAAIQLCTAKYPAQYLSVDQGSGRGFFAYESGAECALAKGAETRSNLAASQISSACRKLYEKPMDLFDELGLKVP